MKRLADCFRGPCTKDATVLVHQVDTGRGDGPDAGPRTADIFACEGHAAEISRESWAWPWLASETGGTR